MRGLAVAVALCVALVLAWVGGTASAEHRLYTYHANLKCSGGESLVERAEHVRLVAVVWSEAEGYRFTYRCKPQPAATWRVPQCPEDAVPVGYGSFGSENQNGWEHWACIPRDDIVPGGFVVSEEERVVHD